MCSLEGTYPLDHIDSQRSNEHHERHGRSATCVHLAEYLAVHHSPCVYLFSLFPPPAAADAAAAHGDKKGELHTGTRTVYVCGDFTYLVICIAPRPPDHFNISAQLVPHSGMHDRLCCCCMQAGHGRTTTLHTEQPN